MNFKWVTLQVEDMQASLDFYRDFLGLEINRKILTEDREIYFLGQGETLVELIYSQGATIDVGGSISLGFETEDLERMMELVKARGMSIHSGPFFPSETTSFCYVEDPTGYKIQLVEVKAAL